jgi:hypothetical protein
MFHCTGWSVASKAGLFFLRVLKFSNKHRLYCASCGWGLRLESGEFKQVDRVMRKRDDIDGTEIHTTLSHRIEKAQLAGKTPTQVKFIRESLRRAEQDRQARSEAVVERDLH